MTKHKVDPSVMMSLWARVKPHIEAPIALMVGRGIAAVRGRPKKDVELEAWLETHKGVFEEGVAIGYDMGMAVAGAPDPEEVCPGCKYKHPKDGKCKALPANKDGE